MHKNAEIVRRGYHAFNTADMETLTELFDENASWHTPGRSIGGDRKGREAVFAQFGRYGRRREAPSRPNCGTCLQMMTGAWSAFITTARSETASAWIPTAASSSSSRTAGLPAARSTSSTSTIGTSSGRSPAAPTGLLTTRGGSEEVDGATNEESSPPRSRCLTPGRSPERTNSPTDGPPAAIVRLGWAGVSGPFAYRS